MSWAPVPTLNNIPRACLFRLVQVVSYAISLYHLGPAVPLVSQEEAVVCAHLALMAVAAIKLWTSRSAVLIAQSNFRYQKSTEKVPKWYN